MMSDQHGDGADGGVDRDESTTAKGNRHENEAKAILKRVYGAGVEKVDGWGNHDPFGFVDLIAIKAGEPVKFVQVKTNRFTAEHKRKYRSRTRHLPAEHAEFEVWVRHDRQGWVLHKYRPEAGEFEHLREIPVCDRREAAEEYRDAVDSGDLVTDGGVDQHGDEDDRQPNNFVSTFPYPGNKGRQSDWIIEKLPPHDTYVEVFGGAAGILYNKPPSTNEVYNDINQDLVQFFRTLRNQETELVEWLEAVPYARSLYEEWVTAFFNGHRPDDPIERAGRFFVLRYMQFAGDMTGPNGFKTRAKRSPARTFNNARMQLHEIADRFNEVIIENKDFGEVLEIYDDEDVDVLFYLDPPYVGAESYYGGGFDHARLADCLESVDSDWMVSYSEVPDELEAVDGVTILHRSRRHRMCRGGGEANESLVCSFDPSARSQFLGDGSEQKRLMTDGGREQDTDEGSQTLVIVGSGSAKRDRELEPERLRVKWYSAKELYTSTYFAKKRDYAETVGDQWMILSAHHGLILPGEETKPYDRSIDDLDDDPLDSLAHRIGMTLIEWFEEAAGDGDGEVYADEESGHRRFQAR